MKEVSLQYCVESLPPHPKKRKKDKNFTCLYNDCINDSKLNQKQLSLLLYMVSKPSNWKFKTPQLAKRFNISIKTIRKQLNHIESIGYIQRNRPRRVDGTFSEMIYLVSDERIYSNNKQPGGTFSTCGSPSPLNKKYFFKKNNQDNIQDHIFVEQLQDNRNNTSNIIDESASVHCIEDKNFGEIFKFDRSPKEPHRKNVCLITPFGLDEVYNEIFSKFNGLLSKRDIVSIVDRYGPVRTQVACSTIQEKDIAKISNLGGFLSRMIERQQSEEIISPRSKKVGNFEHTEEMDKENFKGKEKNEQNTPKTIEELEKNVSSYVNKNKDWYLSQSKVDRLQMVKDVIVKWPYLNDFSKLLNINLEEDDFCDSPLFETFFNVLSEVLREKNNTKDNKMSNAHFVENKFEEAVSLELEAYDKKKTEHLKSLNEGEKERLIRLILENKEAAKVPSPVIEHSIKNLREGKYGKGICMILRRLNM